jgi:hypothetical protein
MTKARKDFDFRTKLEQLEKLGIDVPHELDISDTTLWRWKGHNGPPTKGGRKRFEKLYSKKTGRL